MRILFVFVFLILLSIVTGLDLKALLELLEKLLKEKTRCLSFSLFPHNKETQIKEVAYGKSCRQSSIGWGENASRAVDGDLNTKMHTYKDQSPYWIVDLEKPYKIKRIEIFNRQHGAESSGRRLHDLDIMVGTSPHNMHICTQYKGPAQLKSHLVLECRDDERARYVKLVIRGKEYLHVAEVKVYALVNKSG
ncbi:unnamed protein product [Mytilus edulis]|uniref:Fucolectin tachylectin-4 pentraxin-1 domain-containing protein n=1 Tax=Mytilus edulis TaxID=6550 RepID=A0A8S3TLP5_MYTED|nr:unnamed protein product [Mytilus edulis]